MPTTTKCLNEWNATIEALGQGIQSILIRKYPTNQNSFLLNPTVSYTSRIGYIENFKKEYQSFVKQNAFPKQVGNNTEIKYYAEIEKIVEKQFNSILRFNKYHIWTNTHVKSYVGEKIQKFGY